MSQILASWAAIAAIGGDSWHAVNQVYEGTPMCAVAQEYADGSFISVVVTAKSFASDEFRLIVSNPSWSIKEGDAPGEIIVSTPTGEFSSLAAAREHAFAVTGRMTSLEAFLGSAKIGGFTLFLAKKQRVLGEYAPGGLEASLPEFQRCIVKRFDPTRDPFRK